MSDAPVDLDVGSISADLAEVSDTLVDVTVDIASLTERLATVEQSVGALIVPAAEVHWKVHARGRAS